METFILFGMLLLEKAYRFAKKVLPHLPVRREVQTAKTFTWSTLFDRDLSNASSTHSPDSRNADQ
ncbi:MAG: FMNH2-dependent alkanesulfonate monooxygenase (EC [uncultured Caballeronia sp.]|nr:MAG: FMNH2-dependent alkanesulfonate monooxygenase (EC [uncultured Caballeronia sp.]